MKMYNNIVITGANSPYFESLLTLINSIHKDSFDLVDMIVVYDFGLDQTALIWFQPDGKYINIIDEYVNDGTSSAGSDIYNYID